MGKQRLKSNMSFSIELHQLEGEKCIFLNLLSTVGTVLYFVGSERHPFSICRKAVDVLAMVLPESNAIAHLGMRAHCIWTPE